MCLGTRIYPVTTDGALSLSFFGSVDALSDAVSAGGPGSVVHNTSIGLLGGFGGIVAMLMITSYVIKRAKGNYIADESVDEEQNEIDLETV